MSITEIAKGWSKPSKEVEVMHPLIKPTMFGIIVDLRTGRTRKPRLGEIKPLVIDRSPITAKDGEIVRPERKVRRLVSKNEKA